MIDCYFVDQQCSLCPTLYQSQLCGTISLDSMYWYCKLMSVICFACNCALMQGLLLAYSPSALQHYRLASHA